MMTMLFIMVGIPIYAAGTIWAIPRVARSFDMPMHSISGAPLRDPKAGEAFIVFLGALFWPLGFPAFAIQRLVRWAIR